MMQKMRQATFEGKPAMLRLHGGRFAIVWQDGCADREAAEDESLDDVATDWRRSDIKGKAWTITETPKLKKVAAPATSAPQLASTSPQVATKDGIVVAGPGPVCPRCTSMGPHTQIGATSFVCTTCNTNFEGK